jgi:hypothetical protein
MRDPLSCSFTDAERNHLPEGIRMSTRAKVDFFEEMVSLVVATGARDRLAEPTAPAAAIVAAPDRDPGPSSGSDYAGPLPRRAPS